MAYKILTEAALNEPIMQMLADADCEVQIWHGDGSDSPEKLQEAEGFFIYGHPIFDGAIMDTMPNLRVISNFGVGIDHVNLPDAHARGIPVGNTPGFVDGATADMTFALLMAAARNVIIGDNFARSPGFHEIDFNAFHGFEVHGSTLGIIGMGRVGRQVAKRASGFDMNVLYYNRNRDLEAEAELGVTYTPFKELLQQSDFVSLNVPMTDETRNMINRETLAMMKPTAILINMARGGVVDQDALTEALENGTIARAALDVTEPEPLPRDHPLLKQKHLVIAPHLGSATTRTRMGMARRTVENLIAGLTGQPLLNPVE